MLGAEGTFLLGRHRLRGWSRRRLAALPNGLAIERAVSHEGLKLVLLTRLSPAFPFGLLNLADGLSDVSLRAYLVGMAGILPGTILFCALGDLADDAGPLRRGARGGAGGGTWALRVVGVASTVGSIWLAGRAAHRALERVDRG